jgi:hypothetical protein
MLDEQESQENPLSGGWPSFEAIMGRANVRIGYAEVGSRVVSLNVRQKEKALNRP